MTNRPKQRTVREGKLEATLESMNAEIGTKTALALAKYHELYVSQIQSALYGEMDVLKAENVALAERCATLERDMAYAQQACMNLIRAGEIQGEQIAWLETPLWRKLLLWAMDEAAAAWAVLVEACGPVPGQLEQEVEGAYVETVDIPAAAIEARARADGAAIIGPISTIPEPAGPGA